MNKLSIACVLLLFLFNFSSGEPDNTESEIDQYENVNVHRLNEADFDSMVKFGQDANWFIMFYAPWCPHCKKLIPVWHSLARNFTKSRDENDQDIHLKTKDNIEVKFGRIDW